MRMLIVLGLLPIISTGIFHAYLSAAESARVALTLTVDPYPPGVITSLSANFGNDLGEVMLNWFAPGDDGYTGKLKAGAYLIKYDKKSPEEFAGDTTSWWENAGNIYFDLGWIPNSPGIQDTKTIGGLLPKVTYYFAIRAQDKVRNWSEISNIEFARARWDLNPPLAVTDLFVDINEYKTGVVLEWTAPLDPYGIYSGGRIQHYQVKRSTVSLGELSGDTTAWWSVASEISPIEPGEPGTRQSIELKDLTGGVTYYFAIKSFDEQGNVSDIDALFAVREGVYIMKDAATPNQVSGIWGEIKGNKFVIHWSSVEFNNDGTDCEDLAGYYIRYSLNPFDVGEITATVSASRTSYETSYSTGAVYYYSITAFDSAYPWINESEPSMKVDSSEDISLWLCSQKSVIRIPKTIQKIMRKENNSYGDNLDIEIERIASEEKSRILCSYLFDAVENVSKESADKFVFRRPYAEIRLYYSAGPGQTALLQSGDSYSIMWYNGKEWIKLGGDVNKEEGFVSIKTERIGRYQLRRSIRATKFTLVNGPIPKIITPNGDGLNDFCEFFYDNPQNFAPSGKIFDITGAFVANMTNGPLKSDSSGSLRWAGKDNSGRTVGSGIYIYQIEAGGQVCNGTVVVAR